MNLWIRSQDKEVLTKVIDIYKQADTNEIWSYSDKGIKNCLGIYKSKERVLEVLNEIELALGCKRTAFNNTIVFVNVLENVNSMVYEMPEE